MWKWIVAALAVLVLALGTTCYFLVKRATSGGDSAEIAVAATPDRVFASLADADSMPMLMVPPSTVRSSRHGIVMVGDTLEIAMGNATSRASQQFGWIVSEVVAGRLLALELRDSTGQVIATRRDSLVASGDSTLVVSTIASPMMDSLKTEHGDSGSKVGGAILNLGSKLVINGIRRMAEGQLARLKTHLEAGSTTRP